MKKILIALVMLMAFTAVQAQKISYIETTRSWNYVYDENGKKVHTFSTSQGEVVAYSESFYIVKNGSWYYTYNAKGKKLHTFAVSNVGEVLAAPSPAARAAGFIPGTRTARNSPHDIAKTRRRSTASNNS